MRRSQNVFHRTCNQVCRVHLWMVGSSSGACKDLRSHYYAQHPCTHARVSATPHSCWTHACVRCLRATVIRVPWCLVFLADLSSPSSAPVEEGRLVTLLETGSTDLSEEFTSGGKSSNKERLLSEPGGGKSPNSAIFFSRWAPFIQITPHSLYATFKYKLVQ